MIAEHRQLVVILLLYSNIIANAAFSIKLNSYLVEIAIEHVVI